MSYLQIYELERARDALAAAGGTPSPTEPELERLAFYREAVERYGWSDAPPPWVSRVEAWERADCA